VNPRDLVDQPCFAQWGPRSCTLVDQAMPVDHVCLSRVGSPHVCVCASCGDQSTTGGTPWLILSMCKTCRPATGYYCSRHR
jgi:hypothetical protein